MKLRLYIVFYSSYKKHRKTVVYSEFTLLQIKQQGIAMITYTLLQIAILH